LGMNPLKAPDAKTVTSSTHLIWFS
jgi:hypothetical protein